MASKSGLNGSTVGFVRFPDVLIFASFVISLSVERGGSEMANRRLVLEAVAVAAVLEKATEGTNAEAEVATSTAVRAIERMNMIIEFN